MTRIMLFPGILLMFTLSCNLTPKQVVNYSADSSVNESEKENIDFVLKDLLVEGEKDSSLIYHISDDCVFFIQMSDQESDSLEASDPVSYEILSENVNNASLNAYEMVEKLGIINIWSDKRYVRYVYNDKDYILDTRIKNIVGDYCILFRYKTEPKLVEVELLTEDILINFFN